MGLLAAVSYVAGKLHLGRSRRVSHVLDIFGRDLNDCLPTGLRQQLVPLIPDLPGTADDRHDEQRSYMALDWLIRTWVPAWLELSPPCRDDAAKLRELDRIVDMVSAERAGPVVREAKERADAAWNTEWDTTMGHLAHHESSDGPWVAAWEGARTAAAAAAVGAANRAATAAALDAARVAGWVDAMDAARGPAMGARLLASEDALQPTVTALQESAIELYGQMIRVGR